MKSSFFKNKSFVMVLLVALTMSACAKKNTSSVRVAGRATVSGSAVNNGNCSANQPGKIYSSQNPAGFTDSVQKFVSATMDPSGIGTVSGELQTQTGIFLHAAFKFDSAGNVDLANSGFTMSIYDSYVGNYYEGKVIEPYTIQFTQADSGTINRQARSFSITFKDDYGDITFNGTYGSSNIISGTVSFKNYTSAVGGSLYSGVLGQFSIYSCAVVGQ